MTPTTSRRRPGWRIRAIAAATGVAIALSTVLSASAIAASPARSVHATETSCPVRKFECVTLVVPRDHFDPSDARTFSVTFGIHRATGQRLGVWVTATGGPGSSGLLAADSYMAAMDSGIIEHYDLVFYDQRGVGLSEGLACPRAAATFYLSPADARDPFQAPAVKAAAETFSRGCVAESGVTVDDLPFFSTRQSVEDLEAFRSWLGVDRLDLYGESYGTQYVQMYALAHPDRVRSLILDGPVDLTRTVTDYYAEGVPAFDGVLVRTLKACNADPACRRDVRGGDALAAYDRLAARLADHSLVVRFPLGSGRWANREFTSANLETVALNNVYGHWGRMELQRTVAAASHGDLVPALKLLYSDVGVSPDTLHPAADPSWSDAAFYAIECTDYAYFDGTPAQRADAYLASGRTAGVDSARLGRVFYDDLPCAYWPARAPSPERPAPITSPTYPLLVLGSDVDPATAYPNALRIVERVPTARLVTQTNGPHVLYGRGVACVDDIVTALLVEGTQPAARTTCPGPISDTYLPLPPASSTTAAARLHAAAR